jgi:hypothetical protein
LRIVVLLSPTTALPLLSRRTILNEILLLFFLFLLILIRSAFPSAAALGDASAA